MRPLEFTYIWGKAHVIYHLSDNRSHSELITWGGWPIAVITSRVNYMGEMAHAIYHMYSLELITCDGEKM